MMELLGAALIGLAAILALWAIVLACRLIRWPLARRSTADAYRLRLIAKHAQFEQLEEAFGECQAERRKLKLIVAAQAEELSRLRARGTPRDPTAGAPSEMQEG